MKIASRLVSILVIVVVVLFATNSYAHHAQYYVLDGFGGVHAGGGAAALPAGIPYFGFDIAKGIAYIPSDGPAGGDGVLVLDGFGGVHSAGLPLPISPATPYFGFDVARAITYRNIPPRAAGGAANSVLDLAAASSTYTVAATTSITAPDDGFIMVTGSTYASCANGAAGTTLSAEISINVDAITEPVEITNMGFFNIYDCYTSGAIGYPTNGQTVSYLFPVNAGTHTVNLLARKDGGTTAGSLRLLGRSVSAIFVDHGAIGTSVPTSAPDERAALGIGR